MSERVVSEVACIGGRGVVCLVDGKQAAFCNAALIREQFGIDLADSEETAIFGGLDGVLLGRLDFSSRLKEGAAETVSALRADGIRVSLLSGDGEAAVRKTAEARRLAKRVSRIAVSNIALSLGIKGAILVLGIILTILTGRGIPMELAIVADVGAAVLAVLNALRAGR